MKVLVRGMLVLAGAILLSVSDVAKADHGSSSVTPGNWRRRAVVCVAYPCYEPRWGARKFRRFRMFLNIGGFYLSINTGWYPYGGYGYGYGYGYPYYGYGYGYGYGYPYYGYAGLFGSYYYPRYY